MHPRNLHIFSPLSNKDPASFIQETAMSIGDLIVDLCQFPHVVWEIESDKSYTDITNRLLEIPDYWAVAEDWLFQMTKKTGLQDILQIDGYGFWWTLNSLKFEPGLSDFGNCFAWIDILDAIHKQIQPDIVILYGQHNAVTDIVRQVFKKTEVRFVNEHFSRSEKEVSKRSRSGLRIVRLLLGIIYAIYASFKRPHICFLSSTNLLRTRMNRGKRKLQDVYLGEISQAIRQHGWHTGYIEHYGTNASWRGIVARRFFFPTEIVRMLGRALLGSFGVFRQVSFKWERRWLVFQESLEPFMAYKGYDLTALLMPLVRKQFIERAPSIEIQVKLWRKLLRSWKPGILYVNNSYGGLTIPAIMAAKSLAITTIEQQHGIIGKNHKAYLVPKDLCVNTRVPRCDYMILWGEYAKRLLVNSGVYSCSQLRVCGFPRMDSLHRGTTPRSVSLASLDIPAHAQVILYTSNLIVKDFYLTILDSLEEKVNSSVYWIIKLHPGEKTRHLWEDAIQRRHLDSVRVVQEEVDFYELLAACDIHISSVSTTIIEAAVFGKLNIGLGLAYIPDPVGYKEAGAYLPVGPNELRKTVHSLLSDTSQKEKLLQAQKKFAYDWCRNNGTAVTCIVEFIEDKIRMQQEEKV